MEDIVRQNYLKKHNTCPINFTSHGLNKDKNIIRLYGKCLYNDKGCLKYLFKIFVDKNFTVKVFTNKTKIIHPKNTRRIQQVRGVRRKVVKDEFQTANLYYNKQLLKMSKSLRDVGNMGSVISKDVSRKIKSECNRRFDRDKDHLIDLFLMQKDKNWSTFIQKVGNPLEIYLFCEESLKAPQLKKNYYSN